MKSSQQLNFSKQNFFSNLSPNTIYQFEIEARNEQSKTSIKTLTVITKSVGKISLLLTMHESL